LNISFDIDGTLTNYPNHWLDFVYKKTGLLFLDTLPAKEKLGVSEYQRLKNEYRTSEVKYEQLIQPEMKTLNHELNRLGHKIHFNSSRPFDEYSNMLERTESWLITQGMQFESVGSKTPERLKNQAVDMHIDDEIIEINRLYKRLAGLTYCLVNPNDAEMLDSNLFESDLQLRLCPNPSDILLLVVKSASC
jgi:hypothetical protein